jgi:predicted protein tyrosine phosphatase
MAEASSTGTRQANARKTGSIHVCPLSALSDVVSRCNASHLMTCLQDEIIVDTPQLVTPDKHLRLLVHDISEPLAGCVAPDEKHIERLLEFALAWGGEGPMVVHCWAGISRSTAAAFTALCAINPDASERQIATRLRQASPTAYPNRLMIRLADDALGRKGRMVDAVESIGRGAIASEAVPFSLFADLRAP